MAEGAFKQFAKTELVKVCEPLYIFIINIEILYVGIGYVPLVEASFWYVNKKRRGIPFGTPLRGIVSQNFR